MTMQAVPPGALALALADRIPRDAVFIVLVTDLAAQIMTAFRRWSPDCHAVVIPPAAALRGGPGVFAELRRARGPADCVVIGPGIRPEQVLELMAACLPALARSGAVLACLPGDAAIVPDLVAAIIRRGLRSDIAAAIGGEGVPPHMVVRVLPGDSPVPRLAIHAMTLRPAGGVNDKRVLEPHSFLATLPGVRCRNEVGRVVMNAEGFQDALTLVVLQRIILGPQDMNFIRKLRARGAMVVSEFDDSLSPWPSIAAQEYLTFRAPHAVQTSTDVLAAELGRHNPEIAIFPNQMAEVPPRRQRRDDGRVTVFFGAFNRDKDWAPLMPGINRLAARHGERLAFRVIHDQAFFDALETPHKTFTPTCPYSEYQAILRDCDIALLPLADRTFNRAKSDLKALECALHEVAVLAGAVVYGRTLEHGVTGLIYRDAQEFEPLLDLLVREPALRAELTARAYDHVLRHRLLARHVRQRYRFYLSLFARRAAVDAAVLERVPELAGQGAGGQA